MENNIDLKIKCLDVTIEFIKINNLRLNSVEEFNDIYFKIYSIVSKLN